MKFYSLTFSLLLTTGLLLCSQSFGEVDTTKFFLKGRTTRETPLYTIWEPIEFVLEMDFAGQTPTEAYTIEWTCTGDDGRERKGTAPADAPVHIQTVLDRPGFVRIRAQLLDSSGQVVRKPGLQGEFAQVFFDGGAGVDIEQIHGIPAPPDLEAFWARQKAKLEEIPLEVNYRTEVPSETEGVKIYVVSIACPGPAPVTGFLSIPEDAAAGSLPVQVQFQGYSEARQQMMKTGPTDKIVLQINAHGYDLVKAYEPETGEEYQRQFMAATRSNGFTYAFDPWQNSNPEKAYFNGMALRVMRALQFVKSLPEWNGRELEVRGGSQGGLQTIWAAALDHDVTLAVADKPWCCNLAGKSCGRISYGWGIPYVKELNYYDPVHLASWVPATCTLKIHNAGLGDYVCPPSGVAAFYNNLRCPKEIVWVQGTTHGFWPPYTCQRFTLAAPAQTTLE
ncbi:MAG: acetylxylan esterase [Victivallales bacterium]|nr:acetylxylan esterase [Victivallales bacterium]